MTNTRLIITTCLGLFILLGCGKPSNYLESPVVFFPQNILSQGESEEIQTKSMQAMMDSFSHYKWELRSIDQEKKIIVAQSCRRVEQCIAVEASSKEDGSVEIMRVPGQELSQDEGVILKHWVANLQKAYKKYMRR